MATSPDDDRLRWAEALLIERIHGADAPRWIAERIGSLVLADDADGVERFREIARRYEQMLIKPDSSSRE